MAPDGVRPCLSLLLQGRPQTASRTLFLFPDGSGSATAYAHIPPIDPPDLAIYALNCPYVRHPEEMSAVPLPDLITSYIAEIRRRKPHGPYHLGGWSAGGALALRAAEELIKEDGAAAAARGEVVIASFTLLDAPVPGFLGKLPQRFLDHVRDVGMLASLGPPAAGQHPDKREIPKSLLPHFNGTMDVLSGYHPTALDVAGNGGPPKATVLYATETALGGDKKFSARPGDPEDMVFLTEDRTDFSGDGWRNLIPGGGVVVGKAEGANHFTLMV